MNVAEAMTPREELVTVSLPGTRSDALEYLQEQRFSSLPVIKVEDDIEEFRGLVSRQALIEHPEEDQLALLLEEGPTTTRETTIAELAASMADTGARRMPVVDGQLEGIITLTDVLRAIAEGEVGATDEVDSIAETSINAVYAETPLPVAERELSYSRRPYGVVLDAEGEMCGMLTEVDILDVARVIEGETEIGASIAGQDSEWLWTGMQASGNRYLPTRNVELPEGPVREFMTEEVVTTTRTHSARECAQLMIGHDIEQVPLTEGDELVGIVRDSDLLEGIDE